MIVDDAVIFNDVRVVVYVFIVAYNDTLCHHYYGTLRISAMFPC